MSDTQVKDRSAGSNSATPNGMDGRMLSLARRKAMSLGGKAAVGKAGGQTMSAKPQPAARASVVSHPAATPVVADKKADAANKKTDSEDCGCTHAAEQQALEALCTLAEADPTSLGGSAASVRQLCQARRKGLSSQGKAVLGANRKERSAGDGQRLGSGINSSNGLSGRAAARARREALCVQGRGADPACRPSGRVRAKNEAPAKVELGTTLRGTGVTGTQVERNEKVTGNEPGSCRVVTGTEYIGAEQYAKLCVSTPAPAAAKVGLSTTSRGQRVSGTEVGRSLKVTGDERGTGKAVTGTEYLSVEQFEKFSEIKPAPAPAKVAVIATRSGQSVSGTEVGRSSKVTGDEQGSCLKLTGSQYVEDQSASLCRSGSGAPHKVTVMSTVRDRAVTGTDVATGGVVTGAERGACAGVTGTETGGLAQYQNCNRDPLGTPEKVSVMRTWRDQQVSGTAVEHNSKVTGDEYGGCQPISGTAYIGPDQYVSFCDADRQAASRALMSSRGAQANMAMTGLRIGSGDKMTGGSRGESQLLSGTPYSGTQQRVSQRGSNDNPHPLSRSPANAPRAAVAAQQGQMAQGKFSISTPARSAQDSSLNLITGTAYGSNGRITGPVNLAAGLVSGTPEFRHHENASANTQTQPVEEPRSRMTGDGREGGFAITGAAWRRNEHITGTEGFSTRRNPTLRGESRAAVGAVMGAAQQKSRERVEVPMSKVTGSSGTDTEGSPITYSGGARG